MYVSDIHLRRKRSIKIANQVLDCVRQYAPDAVLLGGDLIDHVSELDQLDNLVCGLCRVGPVLAVGGNHDERVGISRVRDVVTGAGGQWIHDCTAQLTHGDRVIAVSGPVHPVRPAAT